MPLESGAKTSATINIHCNQDYIKDRPMFPEIVTERLLLRSLFLDDADTMYAYRSHPDVRLYQSWEPQSLEEVRLFINKVAEVEFDTTGWYQIGITRKSDKSLIGDCGIHILEADPRIAEIGITIAPAMQSKGYATEALKAILNVLFTGLRKHRVFASVDPSNLKSIALMERIGLRKEGHFIQSVWFKDRWADDVVFAMIASEWPEINREKREQIRKLTEMSQEAGFYDQ
jgi:RimJ/RimL family protein N-acetyltransferase